MKQILIFFFFLILYLSALSQHKTDPPILTEAENEAWVDDFVSTEDLNARLKKFKSRLKADLEIFHIITGNPHGKTQINEKYEEKTFYRPLYIFTAEGADPVYFPGNPSEKTVNQLSELLVPEDVASIELLEKNISAMYGLRGRSGVIEVKLNQNEKLQQVKQIILQKEM